MTASAARTTTTAHLAHRSAAYPLALAAAVLGALAAILEAGLNGFAMLTPDGPYQHAADYWFSGCAVPVAIAAAVLPFTLRALQGRGDGRWGLIGIVANALALALLATVCAASVVVGHDIQFGYLPATAVSVIGIALFAAASWRAGLLPRWLLAVWPIVWTVGSFFAVSASPILLAGVYLAMLVLLTRHRPAR